MDVSASLGRVWVAGHTGMLGSALLRRFQDAGIAVLTCGRDQLDLTRQDAVQSWLDRERPDTVFLCASKVGGVGDMINHPADFLGENLTIQQNVIIGAFKSGVKRLVFVASAAIYPNYLDGPIGEDMLFSAPLDPATQWYGLAKLAGVKLCEAYTRQHGCRFVAVAPCNLYGPGDCFDGGPRARVVGALFRRAQDAARDRLDRLEVWGTGTPRRELMHVDDCATALLRIAQDADHYLVNIGSGEEVSIRDLATRIARLAGFDGRLDFLTDKPDGVARKLLDSTRLRDLGWVPAFNLDQGLHNTWQWILRSGENA